ncbi:MAG: rhomboid family intramembrane serine protease [Verrucomicrobia bacterium]|nr:rhomboid family intramembrane serine protease [Verrucomicrobiota bacterium]
MRLIGHLDTENAAQTFGDYLYVKGILNSVEEESDKSWAVWISEEDQITAAQSLLEDFRRNPDAAEYRQTARSAADLRAREEEADLAAKKCTFSREQLLSSYRSYRAGTLSISLILACVGVAVLSNFGKDKASIGALFITEVVVDGGYLKWIPGLQEIRHGEVWRLFTPALIHFGFMHLLFNMMWLFTLGSLIEDRLSSARLALLVVVIAVVSNFAQYLVDGRPTFGGMSGVVYGLFGYVWMRGKFDPASGLFVSQQDVVMMLIWFAVCFTGWVGPIANTVHATGLGLGVAWGWAAAKYPRGRR